MNLHTKPLARHIPNVPVYYFGNAERITIDGAHFTLVNQDRNETVLRDEHGRTKTFTHELIYTLYCANCIEVQRRGSEFDLKREVTKVFSEFPEEKRKKALWHKGLLDEFIRFQQVGKKHPILREKGFNERKVSLGYDCLKILLPILKGIVVERMTKHLSANEQAVIPGVPCPRHFKRLYDRYQEGGFDIIALVPDRRKAKQRASRFHPEDISIWLSVAKSYCHEKRPSMRKCFTILTQHIQDLNSEKGLLERYHHLPSRKTFEKMIKSFGLYEIMSARHGADYAAKMLAIVNQGLEVERPGERVEIDCWRVDLNSNMLITAFAAQLSEEERAIVAQTRLWVTVAIDVATRCILAMKFSTRAPSHHSSLAALEMAASHKKYISDVVGAGDEWRYALVPEEVVTDAGPEFVDQRFETAVLSMGATIMHPPAGAASARGTAERVFRTWSDKFLSYFEGRTFSNVVQRGKAGRVVLNVDEVSFHLTRAVIDIYHNEIHDGLGMTPSMAWDEKMAKFGVIMPLTQQERRKIFGIEVERSISDKGFRNLGIHYQADPLQLLRIGQKAIVGAPAPKVRVRIDQFDLSTADYWDGHEWKEAAAGKHIPKDLSIYEWNQVNVDYNAVNKAGADKKMSVLLAAVRDLRAAGDAATARANLATDRPTTDLVDKWDKENHGGEIVDDIEDDVPELLPLVIAADPLSVGLSAHATLYVNTAEAKAASAPDPVAMTPKVSGFQNPLSSGDEDDVNFE